jgi:hypothetical protein
LQGLQREGRRPAYVARHIPLRRPLAADSATRRRWTVWKPGVSPIGVILRFSIAATGNALGETAADGLFDRGACD